MDSFQVFEAEEGIAAAIRRGVRLAGRGPEAGKTGAPALVVISPKAAALGRLSLPAVCRTVLLPGSAACLLSGLEAASAVSYGTSHRDTITVSSREGDVLWAVLQRELVTVEGWVVERQEFPLPLSPGEDPGAVLAAAGAQLLLGVPPEVLKTGFECPEKTRNKI